MDPVVTWKELCDRLSPAARNLHGASVLADALGEWMRRRGFKPSGTLANVRGSDLEACARVLDAVRAELNAPTDSEE